MKLFNVWHHKLFRNLLPVNPSKDLILFGVNERIPKEHEQEHEEIKSLFPIVFEYELPVYDGHWQARGYCQTTAMMHVYWNSAELLRDVPRDDYVGFMQYDMRLSNDWDLYIQARIEAHPAKTVIFHELCQPLKQVMYETPGLEKILDSYVTFFELVPGSLSLTEDDMASLQIPLLHTFALPRHLFEKMMRWMTHLLPVLDSDYYAYTSYYQAGFAERIHGLFIALEIYLSHPETFVLEKMPVVHEWPSYHNQTFWQNYKVLT
jgi:hypothetical protein